jgi:alpha-tubulin suppressor-like RCC1 family protein
MSVSWSTVTRGFAILAIAGCGGAGPTAVPPPPPPPPTPPPAVATVTVNPASGSLFVGDTLRLFAQAKDAQGTGLARTISWSSSDNAIATISTSGLVTAVSPGGPVIMSATAEGKTGTASISVQPPPPIATLQLDHATLTVALRQDFTLAATAKSASGQVLQNRPIGWSSSNPAIASVGSDGTVTGNQAGSATITAAAEGQSVQAVVTVVALTSITVGLVETCAISQAGKLYCAGSRQGPRARLVAPTLRFTAVFASARIHDVFCAIATDEALYCWGDNYAGELGVGDSVNRSSPTRVSGNLRFKSVAIGQYVRGGLIVAGVQTPAEAANHICGLTTGNDLYCWGDGKSGQFGTGASVSAVAPVSAGSGLKFTEVTAGRGYNCGRAEDTKVYCWGDNTAGHLGQGFWGTNSANAPTVMAGQPAYHGLSGAGATCGLDDNGSAYCWGDNGLLKLGAITTETCEGGKACSTTPIAVSGGLRFVSLHSSQYTTCGLDAAGTVYCWGMNIDDKFGTSIPPGCPTPNSQAPCTANPTPGPTGFLTLSVAAYTVCGLRSNGGAYCWGGNETGQLGYPSLTRSIQPVPFNLDPDTPP